MNTGDSIPVHNWFSRKLEAYSFRYSPGNYSQYEFGDKIILPSSILEIFDQHHLITDTPPIIKVVNNISRKVKYCSVVEYVNREVIYIPNWMADYLGVPMGRGEVQIFLVQSLPVCTGATLIPHKLEFVELMKTIGPAPLLTSVLSNYTVFQSDQIISINYERKNYSITVTELKPNNVVYLHNSEVCVTFGRCPELKDDVDDKIPLPDANSSDSKNNNNCDNKQQKLQSKFLKNDSLFQGESHQLLGDNEMNDDQAIPPDYQQCPLCLTNIKKNNFDLHTIQCQRNPKFHKERCKICRKILLKSDLETHTNELHKVEECECGDFIERSKLGDHKDICKCRLVECKYCNLKIKANTLNDHYTICGNKTVPCPTCGNYITNFDFDYHLRDHQNGTYDSNGPSSKLPKIVPRSQKDGPKQKMIDPPNEKPPRIHGRPTTKSTSTYSSKYVPPKQYSSRKSSKPDILHKSDTFLEDEQLAQAIQNSLNETTEMEELLDEDTRLAVELSCQINNYPPNLNNNTPYGRNQNQNYNTNNNTTHHIDQNYNTNSNNNSIYINDPFNPPFTNNNTHITNDLTKDGQSQKRKFDQGKTSHRQYDDDQSYDIDYLDDPDFYPSSPEL